MTSPALDAGPADGLAGGAFWKPILAPYAQPQLGRSLVDLATSVVPYLGLSILMYFALDVSSLSLIHI